MTKLCKKMITLKGRKVAEMPSIEGIVETSSLSDTSLSFGLDNTPGETYVYFAKVRIDNGSKVRVFADILEGYRYPAGIQVLSPDTGEVVFQMSKGDYFYQEKQ